MASVLSGGVLGQVRRLFGPGAVSGLAEAQLLERFLATRDEAAFAALVARFGPIVLGVCRRMLDRPQDVEDAFQATFLVLVRKAGQVRDREALGPWLYGVARKVAARARKQAARRRDVERAGAEVAAMAPVRDDATELRPVLDEELGRLPEKYRAPVVLCYLDGLTHEEAAARLRCPVGTIRSRMAWAREKLRGRLARRGLALPAGLFAGLLAPEPVPAALADKTVKAGLALAAGKTATAGAISAGAMALSEGTLTTMTLHKMTLTAAAGLAVAALTGGAAVVAQIGAGGPGGPPGIARDQGPSEDRGGRGRDSLMSSLQAATERLAKTSQLLADLRREQEALEQEIAALKSALKEAPPRGSDARPKMPSKDARPKGAPFSAPPAGFSGRGGGGFGQGGAMGGIGGGGAMAGRGFGAGGGRGGLGGGGAVMGGGGGANDPFAGGPAMMGGGGGGMGAIEGMPMRGMGGMMMGGRGGAQASTIQSQSIIATIPGGRNYIRAFSTETGSGQTYRLPKGTTDAIPILSQGVLALQVVGPEVRQVAAFSPKTGTWSVQELRVPAKDQAVPVVAGALAAYAIGHRVYAFSASAGRWDVLELREGVEPVPVVSPGHITVDADGGLYIFSAKTGRWTSLDDAPPADDEPSKRGRRHADVKTDEDAEK